MAKTPSPESPSPGDMARLLQIMQALRDPETGCPWDIKQDFSDIAPYTIEEAYEVADAIDRKDMAGLVDELGDLLFQIVFYAQIARDKALFEFADIVAAISQKMVRRHPHVFGTEQEREKGVHKGFWEDAKARERDGADAAISQLEGVPRALPALSRAVKLQQRAARVGFDWPDPDRVLDKVREELHELTSEMNRPQRNRQAIGEEIGDLLFATANLARHLSVDPEEALRQGNAKFIERFTGVEQRLAEAGENARDVSLERLEAYWQAVKAQEAKPGR